MSLARRVTAIAAFATLMAGPAIAQDAAAPSAPPAEAEAPAAEAAAPPTPAALAFRPLPITGSGNLQQALEASGQFTKFLAAAERTGLSAFLEGPQPLTLLVPTDVAFDTYGAAQLEALMTQDPATDLQRIMVGHIINARVQPDQVQGAKGPVPTIAQTNVEIDGSVTPMKINDAVVLQADVPATNGVIYVIDKVL